MIACIDVDYRGEEAVAACVVVRDWSDGHAVAEYVEHIARIEPYEPGQFYKRELPCLLAVLAKVAEPVDMVVVDGYVWLADEDSPGLGAHLYAALAKKVPVIGVAKARFASAGAACAVCRGDSERPLFVTAAGIDLETAAQKVKTMHGPFRIPTVLRRVDQLCRGVPLER
jgi:deoxyribonuclease V